MARTYRCAEFEVDVPLEWQQQVLHLLGQRGEDELQLVIAEAPSAYHPIPDHEKYDEASNHVAEYSLARAIAEAEFVKARALAEDARKLGDGLVECRGALGHRIDYQHSLGDGPVLHYRELHIVRGKLYLKAQAVVPAARYREVEARLDPLFASIAVIPDARRAELWVDPAWGIEDLSGLVTEAPPIQLERQAMPTVYHPKEGRPGGPQPEQLDPGLTPRRLEYILNYAPGDSAGAPGAPSDEQDRPETEPEKKTDVRRRLDKFLRHSLRPGSGRSSEE